MICLVNANKQFLNQLESIRFLKNSSAKLLASSTVSGLGKILKKHEYLRREKLCHMEVFEAICAKSYSNSHHSNQVKQYCVHSDVDIFSAEIK